MRLAATFALLFVAVPFVSTSALADETSKRALGRDWDVLVHARVESDRPSSSVLRVFYDVENLRDESIEILDVLPHASWDVTSRTLTVNLGAELPVENRSKLVRLGPSEKMSFSITTPIGIASVARSRVTTTRRLVRVKLHFLRARDEQDAESDSEGIWLDRWIENKRSVVTNAIPISTNRLHGAPTTQIRRGQQSN